MLIYHLIILCLLLMPFGISVMNFIGFARIRRGERPARMPSASILVPARNEERVIERCVRSLLAQDYPDMEVIVLDDGSEDDTGKILAELARENPRLRVLQGEPLPPGWAGKNWACHQLAAHAFGDWLMFADADTVHRPESLAAAVAFAERESIGLLSGVPRQQLGTFWERNIVPMVAFQYFAHLPNRWITSNADPRFSAANGQMLLFSRDAYRAIGGHERVRSELVEDIRLGRITKQAGIRTALATATETVECRMYTSLGEIVRGFSKNLFPALDRSIPGAIIFILFMLLLYAAPLFFTIAGALRGDFSAAGFQLPLVCLLMGMSMRGMMAIRFRLGPAQIFHHSLSALMLAAIAMNSIRWTYIGSQWKGRTYS